MAKTFEQDLRLDILNTLLTTPHRRLAEIWPIHRDMVDMDPRFYVRLAAWYSDHGDVRDHKEMFVVTLATSSFPGHRDVGLALLRGLPPYQVVRVLDFIHGRGPKRPTAEPVQEENEENQASGLFRNPPRSLRTEIVRYLREREEDSAWFDSSVLTARKALKRLYALLHVKPSERAQQVLFDEAPPPDSRLFALKELAKAASSTDQAKAIREHKIPYRVAATVIQDMTPEVLAALVERMSPQEVINNLAALQRRRAMTIPAVKTLIDAKLEEAKTATRISAFKAEEAIKAAQVAPELRAKLEKVADTQVKSKGRISRPTALLIDKSGSMQQAIELGKRIGAMISAIAERELFVYAFDTLAYPIEPAGGDLAGWERALLGIKAGGGTSCGICVDFMRRKKQYVEQIILITDEEENTAPLFLDALRAYRQELKADPSVCIVRTQNGKDQLQKQCREAGVTVDVYPFSGDYYSLPNLAALLARPSKLELLMEIMEYPLPVRK